MNCNAEDRRIHGAGDSPQDDRERHQVGRGRHRLDGVVVDADVHVGSAAALSADESADILGDALVGVVSLAASHGQLIVHRVKEPAGRVGRGHPAPPLQDEVQRNVKLDQKRQDRDRHQRGEDPQQLMPELAHVRCVGHLDGVAERPVEEVDPNPERHLELVDEDQEEDVDAGVEALPERDRGQGPGTDRDRRACGEERIGDPQHPLDERNVRDREDDDAEQRRRERQIARQLVVFERFRPVADQDDNVGETEQDRFDREEIGEDREKDRTPEPRQGRERG